MKTREYGTLPSGEVVREFTLQNPRGLVAKIINYGATLTEFHVPDANGKKADVVLGFKELGGYLGNHPYFGATVGRVAGRITGGGFFLDGRKYCLAINNPPNHLHGGNSGFDKRLWSAAALVDASGAEAVKLTRLSPDGEEGYPGNVEVAVTYSLNADYDLAIQYEATTDKATPLSLTNHSYFNLSGEGSGNIAKHVLQIHSDAITATDAAMTMLGRREPAAGKPNDLNQPRQLGEVIPEILNQHGDNYLVRREQAGALVPAAQVWDPLSGRRMEVLTTEDCVQFYSAAVLDGTLKGKSGKAYVKFGGLCLECQGYPEGVNTPELGDIVLRSGNTYRQTTIYRFSNSRI
jgi:aldose 1-epimerase